MDNLNKPQIICTIEKSVNYTLHDCKWVPCSAKFIVLGNRPNYTGIIQIYEICKGELKLVSEITKEQGFRCGTFGASSLRERHLATGGWKGNLSVWNLEKPQKPVYNAQKHTNVINCIDGIGGIGIGCGAPEIVTGSADGSVMVWDVRQKDEPVAHMQVRDGENKRDCWAVTAGNSYNAEERTVVAGYDNGDIKMFDLRKMAVQWETNVRNGVCGLEFDRKDIEMNKLVAATLENKVHVWDMRTQHPKHGYAGLSERCSVSSKPGNSTVWMCRHLPQNRDLFVTGGGAGSLCLWKYNYPDKRTIEDSEGVSQGVVGSLSLLQNISVSTQPVTSLDWSPDKLGLAVCTSYDQTLRVVITTKLNLH